MPQETIAKPFFKSAGGKTRLLPELLKRLPDRFGTYHEPFVGGGALFWNLAASERIGRGGAYLSDLSHPLIAAYHAVQENPASVIRYLRRMPNEVGFFLAERARDPHKLEQPRLAAWFLYLNKTCFNGLWRVNASGKFNTPFGRYDNPRILDEPLLRACSLVLQRPRTFVRHESFTAVGNRARKGDLVYFDPPYLPLSSTSDFTAYTAGGFNLADHERLRNLARDLKKRGVRVVISNSAHPEIKKLYAKGFKVETIKAARAINSDITKRGKIPEFIIT